MMKRPIAIRPTMGAAMLALLAGSQSAVMACATCAGKSDSPMAMGMNAGILTLMVFIGLVLTGIVSFFVVVAKRASAVAEAENTDSVK